MWCFETQVVVVAGELTRKCSFHYSDTSNSEQDALLTTGTQRCAAGPGRTAAGIFPE
jgi:hypothetical protein